LTRAADYSEFAIGAKSGFAWIFTRRGGITRLIPFPRFPAEESDAMVTRALLPEKWTGILDSMDTRLQEALAAADERAARAPGMLDARSGANHRDDLSGLVGRSAELTRKEDAIQAIADRADHDLAAIEDEIRRRRADLESLRQRLAALPGRAIG
jgi:hypothetical protein